jgi:hypothetical protein
MDSQRKIIIELTRSHALVLWDYLFRCDDEQNYRFLDQAEQRALWDLEIAIQPQLPEICDPEYRTIIAAARDEMRDDE